MARQNAADESTNAKTLAGAFESLHIDIGQDEQQSHNDNAEVLTFRNDDTIRFGVLARSLLEHDSTVHCPVQKLPVGSY